MGEPAQDQDPAGEEPAAGDRGQGPAQPRGFKLFVGNLPSDCAVEELNMVFGTYGEVTHVYLMNCHVRTGQRCAFVFYAKEESASDAIQVLNGIYKIREDAATPIQVRWSREKEKGKEREKEREEDRETEEPPPAASRSEDNGEHSGSGWRGDSSWHKDAGGNEPTRYIEGHKLFVGRLPSDVTEEELSLVFTTYGEVNGVHIMKPNDSGMRGAFIFYGKAESAEDAIKVLDGIYRIREDAPEPIHVKWARTGNHGKDKDWGWISYRKSDRVVSSSAKAWQALNDWNDNSNRGWDSGWSEKASWKGGRDNTWQDKSRSSWASSSWESYKDRGWQDNRKDRNWEDKGWRSDTRDTRSGGKESGKGWNGGGDSGGKTSKLYVANLPDDISEEALEYVFGTYGKVDEVHLNSHRRANGCITAFVDFATPEDAETAVAALHENYEIRAGYGKLIVKHSSSRSKPY